MFQLYIDNKLVTLTPKTKIQLTINNPLFNRAGTFTYSISAPKEANLAIFGHVNNEDNLKPVNLPFTLLFHGELFAEGLAVVTNTVDSFEFYLKSGKSAVANLLKSSYLDESINGFSWGENNDGIAGINNSMGKIYPESNFTVTPVATSDTVYNQWDWDLNGLTYYTLAEGQFRKRLTKDADNYRISPVVFINYLINRMIKGLSLYKHRDDTTLIPDFNRIAIFAPREIVYYKAKWNSGSTSFIYSLIYSDLYSQYKNWLPHITLSDFIDELEAKFNLKFYFYPLSNKVDIIHFDTIFSETAIDITHFLVKDDEVPPYTPQGLSFVSQGDATQTYTNSECEAKFEIHDVAGFDDIMPAHKADILKEFFRTPDGRIFSIDTPESDQTISGTYYLSSINSNYNNGDYRLITNETGFDYEALSRTAEVNEHKPFIPFLFPVTEGKVDSHIFISDAVFSSTKPVTMSITVTTFNIGGAGEIIGKKYFDLDATEFGAQVIDILIELNNSSKELTSDRRLILHFYIEPPTETTTVTMKLNGNPNGALTKIEIDGAVERPVELNPLSNAYYGDLSDSDNVTEIEPKGQIPVMYRKRQNRKLFQMPRVDISASDQQTNFAYIMPRGIIPDEMNTGGTAPFSCTDVLDIDGKEYVSRLANPVEPLLSLRFTGEKGTIKQLFPRLVVWYCYSRRPVRKIFKFPSSFLLNQKLSQPFKVKNNEYLISTIAVDLNVDGTIGDSTVDMFTK